MAHRIGARDEAGTSHLEGDVGMELEKCRAARRGRSVTPNVSLWSENRRLYMDNLRLWDCLTLVRSDSNINCQDAIKLVFGLGDDEYLTTFPDTKQLMQLMFPGGVVYHTCSEEARTENVRLKDENSRLHAAVWVLRDNPKLQADSTVAAIFRLTEGQFLAKFHSDIVAQDAGTGTMFNNFHVQNNNRVRKKSYRTVLDMGSELAMAIQLTNTPVKAGPAPCSTNDRRQRCSRSLAPPEHHRRKHSGSSGARSQDFTSNWKPTTPQVVCEHAPGHKTIISDSQLAGGNCRQTFWQHSCQGRQVEQPYSSDGGKLENAPGKCNCGQDFRNPEDQSLQPQEDAHKCTKSRELRRSKTISSVNNILDERFHRGASRALPIKCVSFAEPLCCYRAGCIPANEFVCFRDKVKAILDVGHGHCCHSHSKQKHAPSFPNDAAGNVCGLTKNANSNRGSYDTDARSRVYTAKATREPSKRYQKEVATSPVLHTQACILQSDKLPEAILYSHRSRSNKKCCMTSASDSYMLNKSSNNEDGLPSRPSSKPDTCNIPATLRENRPLRLKHRDIRQARLKNIQSCEKIRNTEAQLRQSQDCKLDTCSTNNAILRFVSRRSTFERLYQANEGFTTQSPKDELKDDDKVEVKPPSQKTSSSIEPIVSVFVPEIYYSDKPAPPRGPKYVQYSIESYPTVKHFLDRHRRIEQQTSFSKSQKEVFTREITPSVAQIGKSDIWSAESSWASSSWASTREEKLAPSDEMQRQQMAQKYKGKWRKKESVRPDDYKCGYDNPWPDYSKPGVPKECKLPICSRDVGLKELKKLGHFQYTKPLATMIKRTGCYQWKPRKGSVNTSGSIALNVRSSLQSGMKVQMVPEGPFITYIPKDKKG